MRNAFIDELVGLAAIHPQIALVVGDLGYSVVEPFADRFPDRFINAGVAEQNMTGLAAGMASEGYHVFGGDVRVGHIDLHFTLSSVYATLVLEVDLAEEAMLDLIDRIDDSLVLSAEVPREDFVVSVYRGRAAGLFTDDFLEERRRQRGGGVSTPSVEGAHADDVPQTRLGRRPN